MIRLLQIEFIKLFNSRVSKVLIIAYFGLLSCISLISVIRFPFGEGILLAEMGIFNFPYIWHFNTWVAALFKLFLAIVIVSMMANEYSNKTIKQNLIDGLSKKEFVLSKFITVICFAAISTIFVFVISLILGLVYSNYTEASIIFRDLEFILAFFVKLVGFFSFCLFLGILVKRSAFALGFLILWLIFEQLIYVLIGWKIATWETAQTVKNFMPLEAMQNLINEPGRRLDAIKTIGNQIGSDFTYDYAVHWYEIAIVLVWTSIFIYLSYRLLKKRDL